MTTWIWAAAITFSAWIVIKVIAGILIIRMATNKANGSELDDILNALHETRFVLRPLVVIARWWARRSNAEGEPQ